MLALGLRLRYGVKPYRESKNQLHAAVGKTQEIGNGFDNPGPDCATSLLLQPMLKTLVTGLVS